MKLTEKSCNGWSVESDNHSGIAYTGLYSGNRLVALVVGTGNWDEQSEKVRKNCKKISDAVNYHDELLKAAKEFSYRLTKGCEARIKLEAIFEELKK